VTTEAKVGAFVLGCFAILAFTVIYLVNAQFSGDTVPYRTYLRYAGGLEPGASVLFGGINVGKVTSVRPWTADPTKIEILLSVKQGTPLNQGSVAKLGMTSIMSSASLSVTTGSNDARRLPPGSSIPSQEAASLDDIAGKMATVADSANDLIVQMRGELEGISGDARNLLANLNTVTGPPTQRKVQTALDRVNTLLATEGPKIDRISDQLIKLSQHADDAVQNVNGTVSDIREPVRKDLVDLQNTLQQAKQLLADMQVIVRANDYKIDDTVENLRVATDNLDQLTDSLKQRPWSLVRIKQPKERAVPQQKVR
jgi:phospholipid/cholesterol/gamma-HCH transport system substrate-binding protein